MLLSWQLVLALELSRLHSFIHSFCSLSYDKSVASSKVSSPRGAIIRLVINTPTGMFYLRLCLVDLTTAVYKEISTVGNCSTTDVCTTCSRVLRPHDSCMLMQP
jgi:hypothetical protein